MQMSFVGVSQFENCPALSEHTVRSEVLSSGNGLAKVMILLSRTRLGDTRYFVLNEFSLPGLGQQNSPVEHSSACKSKMEERRLIVAVDQRLRRLRAFSTRASELAADLARNGRRICCRRELFGKWGFPRSIDALVSESRISPKGLE